MTAITCETPTKQLRVLEDKGYKFLVSVLTSNSVFVLAPQKPDTQFPIEDQTRQGWDRLMADKQGLLDRVRKGKNVDAWPNIVKSAMEDIDADCMNMWGFISIPRMERCTSEKHPVAILGDAAHVIPPVPGQGASQDFEYVMTLALLFL